MIEFFHTTVAVAAVRGAQRAVWQRRAQAPARKHAAARVGSARIRSSWTHSPCTLFSGSADSLSVQAHHSAHSEATISISNKHRLVRLASMHKHPASAPIPNGAITRQRARPAVLWPRVPPLLLLSLTRWRRFCTISMALQCSPAGPSAQDTAGWASHTRGAHTVVDEN